MGAKETSRAFVRLSADKRVVPSSLVLRKAKPKNGRWLEISPDTCCGVGGTVKVDITALVLNSDPTVTVNVGCSKLIATAVLFTTTGGSEALRRANLVSQLNATFVGYGVFTLSTANQITFVSSGECLDPAFTVTA